MYPAAELARGCGEVIVGEVAHGDLKLGVARLGGRQIAKLIFFLHTKKLKVKQNSLLPDQKYR